MKIRFNDIIMQNHYEQLIRDGHHWKKAERKTLDTFNEYDGVK